MKKCIEYPARNEKEAIGSIRSIASNSRLNWSERVSGVREILKELDGQVVEKIVEKIIPKVEVPVKKENPTEPIPKGFIEYQYGGKNRDYYRSLYWQPAKSDMHITLASAMAVDILVASSIMCAIKDDPILLYQPHVENNYLDELSHIRRQMSQPVHRQDCNGFNMFHGYRSFSHYYSKGKRIDVSAVEIIAALLRGCKTGFFRMTIMKAYPSCKHEYVHWFTKGYADQHPEIEWFDEIPKSQWRNPKLFGKDPHGFPKRQFQFL